ncbi:MAG TPA: efflux RND transporter periplasmic adaptor subunit, partial [Blastocatellia bacterium]|nr:efflux RND transporter periplasmic adaptor subunit [Blastocatellia bacterium]
MGNHIAKRTLVGWVAVGFIAGLLMINSGCSRVPAAPPPHPPEVEVTPVLKQDVPIYSEWIGTLDGMVNAEIKAQVSGYLRTRNYTEGTYVRKGQLLFQIDPRPFQAALDQAQGALSQAEGQVKQATAQLEQARAGLAQAEANQQKAQFDEDRYIPLARAQAVTQQDLDNAVQTNRAAKAQVKSSEAGVQTATAAISAAKAVVESAKAAVATAQLNLGFTRILSPIDGIAGIASAQVGDLVGPGSQVLSTVSSVDPIKAYFTVSEQEYLNYAETKQDDADALSKKTQLELILADGSTYPRKGTFYVADRNVDEKTGAIRLAGLFPNPGNILRPGQYAKVRAVTSTKTNALLVPQRAVSELQGTYRV